MIKPEIRAIGKSQTVNGLPVQISAHTPGWRVANCRSRQFLRHRPERCVVVQCRYRPDRRQGDPEGEWAGSTSLGTHPTGYVVVGIGNFAGNADGTTGDLFYNQSTGDYYKWLIANGKWAGSIDLGSHPGNYQVAGVGTFTGNNTADVLFTHPVLG